VLAVGERAAPAAPVTVGLCPFDEGVHPGVRRTLGWMGPEGFAPGIFQALAAISEFGGGVAWRMSRRGILASSTAMHQRA